MNEDEWTAYKERHDLVGTDHERVWWTHDPPDHRAFEAATRIADEFPELKVVGTESRTQMSDVSWRLGDGVLILGFYPIRAHMWTEDVIDGVREAIA